MRAPAPIANYGFKRGTTIMALRSYSVARLHFRSSHGSMPRDWLARQGWLRKGRLACGRAVTPLAARTSGPRWSVPKVTVDNLVQLTVEGGGGLAIVIVRPIRGVSSLDLAPREAGLFFGPRLPAISRSSAPHMPLMGR